MTRRLGGLVVCALLLPASTLGGRAVAEPAPDLFEITAVAETPALTPEDWTVTSPEVVSTANGVTARNRPPAVVSWNPATRQMTLRLGVELDAGALQDARLVIDWISPSYDLTLAPEGVSVRASCHPRAPGPRLDYVFGRKTGYGHRYGECFELADLAAPATATVDVPLAVGEPGVAVTNRFRLVFHVEDASEEHRLGIGARPALGEGKLVPPAAGAYLGLSDTWPYRFFDAAAPWDWSVKVDRFSAKAGEAPAFVWPVQTYFLETTPSKVLAEAAHMAKLGTILMADVGLSPLFPQEDSCGTVTYQKILEGACGGRYDAWYRALAVGIRNAGVPILLTTSTEGTDYITVHNSFGPNGDQSVDDYPDSKGRNGFYGDPTVPDGPERYRDYHRRVVDLFNEVGAVNVTWSINFNPQHDTLGGPHRCATDPTVWLCERYVYPGDEYVDWIRAGFFPYDEKTDFSGDEFSYEVWQDEYPQKPLLIADEHLADTANPLDPKLTLAAFPRFDRSALFDDTMNRIFPEKYPNYRAIGWWEDAGDSPLWLAYGSADIGFFHPAEADVFRSTLDDGWTGAPVLAPDVTPPERVADLAVTGGTLTWTAPGDDGPAGTASSYSLRCRPGDELDVTTWSAAGTVSFDIPAPSSAGSHETAPLPDLGAGPHLCALTTTDDASLTSPLSNVVAL